MNLSIVHNKCRWILFKLKTSKFTLTSILLIYTWKCRNRPLGRLTMHQNTTVKFTLGRSFSALQRPTPPFFCFTSVPLMLLYNWKLWSHGINKRHRNNSGAKGCEYWFFFEGLTCNYRWSSSYIQKWISPGQRYKVLRLNVKLSEFLLFTDLYAYVRPFIHGLYFICESKF